MTKKKTEPQSNNFYNIVYIFFDKERWYGKEIVGREAKAETAKESLELKISLCYIQHTYTSIIIRWCIYVVALVCIFICIYKSTWMLTGLLIYFFALLTQIFHSSVEMSKQMWVMLSRFVECSLYVFNFYFGGKSKLNLAISKITNTFHSSGDPFTLCCPVLWLINSWYM